MTHRVRAVAAIIVGLICAANGAGYSVVTHEALVDAAWDLALKGILLKRFPLATPEGLKEAHAYAYGGAVIQDSGSILKAVTKFSDFTHYVRAGDFILSLLSESQMLDGTPSALGRSHTITETTSDTGTGQMFASRCFTKS
ncbi:MAG: hypothetical protein JO033_25440 [Acidobacteriaceae bacterium]|nr:hypothetical protein [Acidobacteriaceae bacterium]